MAVPRRTHRVRTCTVSTPVIALITEWRDEDGTIKTRDANSDSWARTMCLKQSPTRFSGTLGFHSIYGSVVTGKRHRHRYEANTFVSIAEARRGLVISARSSAIPDRDRGAAPRCAVTWFIGVQSPEFANPRPGTATPLFNAFVKAPEYRRRKV